MRISVIQTTIFLLGLLIGCGFGFLRSPFFANSDEQFHSVQVLVATQDIPSGVVLDAPEKLFVVKAFLSDTAPPGYVSHLENVRDKVIFRRVDKGEACTERHFSDLRSLPPGMQAISMGLPSSEGYFDFIQFGARVDVLLTERDTEDPNRNLTTKLLEDVEVLATYRTHRGDCVVVAVTSENAIEIESALQRGRITFVLR